MVNVAHAIKPKSDQLNADDLIGGPITIKITNVREMSGEQPIAISFEGDNGKPYKPGKSMLRVMVEVWGLEGDNYIGHSLTLYRDPEVKFGGQNVGGIRISHMTGLNSEKSFLLTVARSRRAPYTVKPLKVSQPNSKPAVDPEEAYKSAKTAADKGTEAFKAWWVSEEGKRLRGWITEEDTARLQDACSAADKANDDTFPGDR